MVTKSRGITALIVILAAAAIFFIFYKTDAQRIKSKLDLVCDVISKTASETNLALAAKSKKSATCVADPCMVNSQVYGISRTYKPSEISTLALSLYSHFEYLNVTYEDLKIELTDKRHAQITFTGQVKGKTRSGELVDDLNEIHAKLVKPEKHWLFSEVTVVDVLKK